MPFIIALIVWWAWIPLVALAFWGLQNLAFPGMGTWHLDRYQLFNEFFFHDTAGRNIFLLIGAIGTVGIGLWALAEADKSEGIIAGGIALLGVVVLAFQVYSAWSVLWDNDKDAARYYGSATQFIVPDIKNPPQAMAKLLVNNTTGDNGCQLYGPSGDDVFACINQGFYPADGWQPRVSSLDGATIVMKRTSGNVAGANLDENSIVYLNGENGQSPRWSGVRDGSGLTNPLDGVVEWDGSSPTTTTCRFEGNDKVDRAIHGSKGNSLPNLLNDRFPKLQFDFNEYWGYCDAENHPVIVFPVTKQVPFKNLLVDAPYGVVVMTGSANGHTNLRWQETVKAGDFPGPVYPKSTVDSQIAATEWAGGRRIKNNQKFGFDTAQSDVQAGNDGDYLLESRSDHRLYWVTPLTPRYSDSQLFVAYSVTPADEVHAGGLNTHKIYVVSDKDTRQVNIDQLSSYAKNYLSQHDSGFFPAGGKLVEFTPQQGDTFRAYAELNGRVTYRMDVSADYKTEPVIVALDANSGTPSTAPVTPTTPSGIPSVAGATCDTPSKLTTSQIAQCLQKLSTELAKRSK
jgi:hypothetical protein